MGGEKTRQPDFFKASDGGLEATMRKMVAADESSGASLRSHSRFTRARKYQNAAADASSRP
jgi:hypothetical protein